MSARKPLAIGIDVGATSFRVAVCRGDDFELIKSDTGKEQTPCYARLDGDHEWTIGDAAKHSVVQETARTVFFVKRLLGESIGDVGNYDCLPFIRGEDIQRRKIGLLEPCSNTTRNVSPIEIYSEFLRKARENAEIQLRQDSIQYAVITIPDTFNAEQQQVVLNAANIAGLHVLRIMYDTCAAVMYYLATQTDPGDQKSVLIFDLGGGSFKLSAWHIENEGTSWKKDFLLTEGNHSLGGFDFDSAIARHVLKKLPGDLSKSIKQDKVKMWYLLDACKTSREALSIVEETYIDLGKLEAKLEVIPFNRKSFQELDEVRDLLSSIRKAIEDVISKQTDISEVVTMGGASNMTCIQEIVASCCKGIKINRMLDANETVVFGAAYEAFHIVYSMETFHDAQDDDVTKDLNESEMFCVKEAMASHRERRKLEQSRQDWMNQLVKMVIETQDVVKKLHNRGDFDEQCQMYITWEKENSHAPIQQVIYAFESAKTLKERVIAQQLDECRKIAVKHALDQAKETPRLSESSCFPKVANDLHELKMRLCTRDSIIKVCNYSLKQKNNEIIILHSIKISNCYTTLRLEIYTNGCGKGEKNHMSLCITTSYCEENQISCKISLLNQKEDADHYEHVVQLKYEKEKENKLFVEEFIDNITLSKYVDDNSIVLKLELLNLKPWLRSGYIML